MDRIMLPNGVYIVSICAVFTISLSCDNNRCVYFHFTKCKLQNWATTTTTTTANKKKKEVCTQNTHAPHHLGHTIINKYIYNWMKYNLVYSGQIAE